MLERRGGFSEPGIVGDRHHELRPIRHELPHEVGKDHFVANHDAEYDGGPIGS